ncbi:NIPSNAP family protein [Nonomuraea sp. C10]|uniref:NIPSNAP family protein n=1 Tax=Nonomuraea sp. C10 TaxID=2600577 RepID=UPI0011CD90A2|nr:NIPSNAP family protein [Nonomuraea sp. C10]TXK42835.1 NIPSNAP family protein [Nonomuraea sp. C10]
MIYELRRYTMVPGARDVLIDLFEREFVETQEEAGMRIVGHFRNPDDPDQYPWIRSFPDMEARKAALTAFYSGPAWKANRDAANATMLDSDDVLLLRPVSAPDTPAWSWPRPLAPTGPRPPVGATALPSSLYVATICHVEDGFAAYFASQVAPALVSAGAPPLACFETEPAANTFPALPVREGENVFIWLTRFERAADELPLPTLDAYLTAPPQRLRLSPAARSALR